ncbi:MAG TPA: endonuclease/exonuclease/phosphatase family protein [Thermoanaerobaculia bacterium]|nr:endonuclease/exonuclease/phosphatase family protein [Thermoanaerobaculia bacterium]
MNRHQRKRIALLSLALAVLAFAPLAASPPGQANDPKSVTVMTRNLYLGADVAPAVAAIASGDPAAIVAAVSEVWGKVRFTDFPARAEGIAREIAAAQPDLIGLQEAEMWRSQTPADVVFGNADHVEYDFVQILLQALEARGLHYAVVAEEHGFDIELPGFLSQANAEADLLSDIRLTEREVILARSDLKTSELKLSNSQTGHFATNVEFPISPDFTFVLQRGWASVDAKVRGKSFRFVTTHLEADSEQVREAQALEVVLGPANTSLPVVLVADANSNANGDATTPAYSSFVGVGFADAWFEAHSGNVVSTCCNAELLDNPTFPLSTDDEGRIDLVLYRGARDFAPIAVGLFGTDPTTDRVSNGVTLIWPSDHAGVAAKLQILK